VADEGYKPEEAVVMFVTVKETGEIFRCNFIPDTYRYIDTPERLDRIKNRLSSYQIPWRTGEVSYRSDMVEFGQFTQ
jgi:hypothetical protein